MSIIYSEALKSFALQTRASSYQMGVDRFDRLRHLYYGRRMEPEDLSYLYQEYDRAFSGNPYELGNERGYSLDVVFQEFSSCGVGDYRIPSLRVVTRTAADALIFAISAMRYVRGNMHWKGFRLPGTRTETPRR